ncbi:hypothetical protein ABIF67_010857 [Bradyrhizobium japonicum]
MSDDFETARNKKKIELENYRGEEGNEAASTQHQ